jgi:hypothetical protein
VRARLGRERLHTNLSRVDLPDASLAEVLLHGLSPGDDDLAVGVLVAARGDLESLATLGEGHADRTIRRVCGSIEMVARRIDVALDLLRRGGRGTS